MNKSNEETSIKTQQGKTPIGFCASLMEIHQRNARTRGASLIKMQRQFAEEMLQNEANLNELLEVLSPEFGADVRIVLEKISGRSKHLRN